MPCFVTIRVVEARGLPVMDHSTGLADAFVEVREIDSSLAFSLEFTIFFFLFVCDEIKIR